MAGQWPERSDSLKNKQPRTVESFARALKPTPSEISVASTAYSSTGQSMFEEDIPPVPPVPLKYTQPYLENESTTTLGQAAPAPAPEMNDEQPPFPFVADPNRQKGFDLALARLEGTYVPSDDADSLAPTTTSRSLDPAEHEQRRFEKWLKQQGSKATQAREQDDVQVPPPTTRRFVIEPTQTGSRATRQDAGPSTSRLAKVKKFAGPVPTDVRAADPTAYYPYVADPKTVKTAGRTLKAFAKKAKEFVVPGRGLKARGLMAAEVGSDPDLREAVGERMRPESRFWDGMAGQGSDREPHQGYGPRPAATQASGSSMPTAPAISGPKLYSKSYSTATAMSLEDAQKKFLGRPELTPLFIAATTPVRSNMAAPQPRKPIKIIGDPDRGTVFGDIIEAGMRSDRDLPATAAEVFDPKPRAVSLLRRPSLFPSDADVESSRPIRRPSFVPDESMEGGQDPAALAAEYQLEIATPHMSPADFSEIQGGVFPTGRRVLYDPGLSSPVELPRFDGRHPSAAAVFVGDAEEARDRMSKALREDRQREHRARNASKRADCLAEIDRREKEGRLPPVDEDEWVAERARLQKEESEERRRERHERHERCRRERRAQLERYGRPRK